MSARTKRPNASTVVADGLRAKIMAGGLGPGVRLLQEAIAEEYLVSQSVVREAFKQLEAEGFVRADPKRGVSVAELTREDAAELVRLRCAIEAQALELAIPHLTAETLAAARATLDELEAASTAEQVIQLNARFHDTLYAPCGQRRTLALVHLLRQSFDRYFRLVYDGRDHLPYTHAEHRHLRALCEAGEVEQACALLRHHVVGTGEALMSRPGL